MAKRVSRAFGTKRPKGLSHVGPSRARSARNDNTGILSKGRSAVRTLSSEASKFVGRPGFGGFKPGPVDGKLSVKRLMQRDPSKGITSKAADNITTTHVDLLGDPKPRILAANRAAAPNAGKKVVSTPRFSQPVNSNKPGRVKRSPGSK